MSEAWQTAKVISSEMSAAELNREGEIYYEKGIYKEALICCPRFRAIHLRSTAQAIVWRMGKALIPIRQKR